MNPYAAASLIALAATVIFASGIAVGFYVRSKYFPDTFGAP